MRPGVFWITDNFLGCRPPVRTLLLPKEIFYCMKWILKHNFDTRFHAIMARPGFEPAQVWTTPCSVTSRPAACPHIRRTPLCI